MFICFGENYDVYIENSIKALFADFPNELIRYKLVFIIGNANGVPFEEGFAQGVAS